MNDSTSTPIRQKGRGVKLGAVPKPATVEHQIGQAFSAIASTLLTAAQTDDDQYSGDSNRLLRVAGALAETAESESADGCSAEGFAYDIAALVKSALLVPGDMCSLERMELIDEARLHLEFLTDCQTVLDLAEVHAAPAAAAYDKSVRDYTHEQMKIVLEMIAGRMRTLQRLLMIVQGAEDHFETAACLDAAYIIATELGAAADTCTGSSVVGDRDRWTFGPSFATAGKAVQA